MGGEIERLQKLIMESKDQLAELRRAEPRKAVKDYTFAVADGTVKLSELFCGKRDLIVVHNMGATCPYCTMWADGFNGLRHHIGNRAAFVVRRPTSHLIGFGQRQRQKQTSCGSHGDGGKRALQNRPETL